MRAVPLFLTLVSTVIGAPLAAQSTTVTKGVFETVKQAPDNKVDSTTQADDVKFRKDVNDRMTVSVRLSGTPFRFLVDTGADRTAISRDVAARLGLAISDTASLHSMTGVSTVQTATVPDLEFSNSEVRVVDAPLLDAANMGADGILGTDSLHSQRVIFDFDKNLMTIVPAEERVVPKDEGTIVVTGRMKNGRLIVTDAIADDNRITVILDTGSQVSVGNEALRLRLANRGQLRETGAVQLQSVTGDLLNGEYTFVKKLVIGEVGLSNLAVVFADAHTFKQLGLDKRPALLLGMNALRAFKKVSIDFANRKLRVMLPETGSIDNLRLAAR